MRVKTIYHTVSLFNVDGNPGEHSEKTAVCFQHCFGGGGEGVSKIVRITSL